jgi:hypothetical protein
MCRRPPPNSLCLLDKLRPALRRLYSRLVVRSMPGTLRQTRRPRPYPMALRASQTITSLVADARPPGWPVGDINPTASAFLISPAAPKIASAVPDQNQSGTHHGR